MEAFGWVLVGVAIGLVVAFGSLGMAANRRANRWQKATPWSAAATSDGAAKTISVVRSAMAQGAFDDELATRISAIEDKRRIALSRVTIYAPPNAPLRGNKGGPLS